MISHEELLSRIDYEIRKFGGSSEAPTNLKQSEIRLDQSTRQLVDIANIRQPVDADLVIINARDREYFWVKKLFTDAWSEYVDQRVLFNVGSIRCQGRDVKVAIAQQNHMGMVPASILTMKAIRVFSPRFIVMTGICGGMKDNNVNIGDIIIADQVYDWGSGKLVEGILLPDYQPIPMDDEVLNLVKNFITNEKNVSDIRASWPSNTAGLPDTSLRALAGPMASGAAVVCDDRVAKDIEKYKRKVIGIDMEAYGVAKAATTGQRSSVRWLIAKGVSDFADANKVDSYQDYAAFVSASFLKKFVEHYCATLFPDDGMRSN